ncbi:MAG TPA: LysR family transcriptional regulator [Coriobacteriia bacterium]|nr:LysR family transcriptional regulator [Coriobacteriia bacterium]
MLTLNRLRILREIDQRGTVTAAAKALWMTPPSVSQHMSAMEAETGVQLLERVGRRVRLTPAAKRLVAHTERIFAEVERAESDLALARDEIAGTVTVAAPSTVGRSVLIPAAVSLERDHPALDFIISDIEQPESLIELKSGNVDIAIGLEYTLAPACNPPGFDIEHLMSEPVYLAMPSTHPLAAEEVRLEQLAGERWFAARDPNPCRDAVLRATAYCGFEPRIELLSSIDYQLSLAAVSAGLGVMLVPALALYTTYPGVVLKPLVDVPLRRRIFAALRQGSTPSPQMAAVLAAIRQAADEVSAGFGDTAGV